jgi:hypothetical protein
MSLLHTTIHDNVQCPRQTEIKGLRKPRFRICQRVYRYSSFGNEGKEPAAACCRHDSLTKAFKVRSSLLGMAAPLYTTDSGLYWHAGKIVVVTVGLPARGKTHLSRALERYLRWLGIKTQVVSLGDNRRRLLGGAKSLPPDYFSFGLSAVSYRIALVIVYSTNRR